MAGKERFARLKQIGVAYRMTRRVDPHIGWVLLAAALATLLVFFVIGLVTDAPILWTLLGIMPALLVAMIIFGRRAERAAYRQIEGQVGAAAGVLNTLRRGWTVTPAVAVTRNQDIIHRAVGRPGIVLVGEGAPTRLSGLLAAEKRKISRFVPEAPVYDVIVGDNDGQVRLRKLPSHLAKLPRNLRPAEVREVNNRLRALPQQPLPVPKGPMPRNARMPKMPRPPSR
jgi:Domain of unknown function (DUF4191)